MSGDSVGYLVGGALLLGALPMIATGALAAGTAYAAVKIGQFSYRQCKRYRQLNASPTASAAMRRTTGMINHRLDDQAQQTSQLRARQSDAVRQCGQELQHALAGKDYEQIRRAQQALEREMQQSNEMCRAREELHRQARQDIQRMIADLDQAHKAFQALTDWNNTDEGSRRAQHQIAMEAIEQARASTELLRQLEEPDQEVAAAIAALSALMDQAEQTLHTGQYQATCVIAQSISSKALMSAAEAAQREIETEERRSDLLCALEGWKARLQATRAFTFTDRTGREEKVDLAEYCQHWEDNARKLNELSVAVPKASGAALLQIEKESASLIAQASQMINTAVRHAMLYYEKLMAAEMVIDLMGQNNFTCVDAAQPNNDKAEDLLCLRFAEPGGTEFVVSLDTRDFNRMDLGLHVVPGTGRLPSEQELDAMRGHLTDGLGTTGLKARLECQGNVYQPTSRPEYIDLAKLRQNASSVLSSI